MTIDLTDLIGVDWEDAPGLVDAFVTEASQQVVRWAWAPAAAALEHPVPLWSERDGRRPVTQQWETPPRNRHPDQLVAYGFNRAGRVQVSRRPGGPLETTSMWIQRDSQDVQLLFQPTGVQVGLVRVALPEGTGDKLAGMRLHGSRGWRHEHYDYDDQGRLSRIVVESGGSAAAPSLIYEVDWDEAGTLLLLRAHRADESDSNIVFRRPTPDALRVAQDRLRDNLVAAAYDWAIRTKPDRPLAALIVFYPTVDPRLPPCLGSTTEPGQYEMSEVEHLDDEPEEFLAAQIKADSALVTQEWRTLQDDKQARRFHVDLANRLRARDWTDYATPEFLVVAVDFEAGDLAANLRVARKAAASI